MYLEYVELYKKYKKAEEDYYNNLNERSRLTSLVELGSSKIREVVADGNMHSSDSKIIEYVNKIDSVDYLINQSRNTRDMLKNELNKKAFELQHSVEVIDRVYYYRWIEKKSVRKFYRIIGYSKSRIYDYIDKIKKNIYKK